MPIDPLNHVQVFFGAADNAEARVYARLAVDDPADFTLSGKVHGPECLYAKTLPTSFRLVDRGPGSTLLAEAIVTDPCFWSCDLPFLYRVDVDLLKEGQIVASTRRMLGIRLFGAKGNQLIWEGKNWVMRAARRELAAEAPLTAWREAMLAMIVNDPDDELLTEASRQGVMIVAEVSTVSTLATLERLARWPAVVLAVTGNLDGEQTSAARSLPNLLTARRCDTESEHVSMSPFPSIRIMRNLESMKSGGNFAEAGSPLIAERRMVETVVTVAELRAACDHLQRDIAGCHDVAGYFIV
jgi:hypothetical protein